MKPVSGRNCKCVVVLGAQWGDEGKGSSSPLETNVVLTSSPLETSVVLTSSPLVSSVVSGKFVKMLTDSGGVCARFNGGSNNEHVVTIEGKEV